MTKKFKNQVVEIDNWKPTTDGSVAEGMKDKINKYKDWSWPFVRWQSF